VYISNEAIQKIKPQIFDKNKNAYGGTEYMVDNFLSKIAPEMPKLDNYLCVVMPGEMHPSALEDNGVPIIVWLHNTLVQFNQSAIDLFNDPIFSSKLKYLIVVSDYHKQETVKQCNIDPNKIIVIQNAIDSISYNKDKFSNVDKVKLIHASSADRGMEVLLRATELIEEDFELNIFNDFYPERAEVNPKYSKIFEDPRINFYGKTPRKTVLRYFGDSHIHAYPTVYEETSCLTQIEALATNCLAVYSDIGVLKETSMGYGMMANISKDSSGQIDIEEYVKEYASLLTQAIQKIKSKSFDPQDQAKTAYSFYSWERAKERWLELHNTL
jgi:UDP-glucose:(glucosyl)LPS alpha-1,2-glucosyltransferase